MQRRLKERLTGAAVLVMLAVIFIPMLLDNSSVRKDTEIIRTNIPEKPDSSFNSRVIPLEPPSGQAPPDDGGTEPDRTDRVTTRQPEEETSASPAGGSETELETTDKQTAESTGEESVQAGLTAWVVQIGSFSSEENARSLNEAARKQGFTSFVEPVRQAGKQVYRVRVGPELLRSDAKSLAGELKEKLQVEGIILRYP